MKVGIIMGSDSDLSVMQDAAAILSQLGVEYELTIVSAHRTPDRLVDYGKNVHKNGIGVVIAGAGDPNRHRYFLGDALQTRCQSCFCIG